MDYELVWDVVQNHIPVLRGHVASIIEGVANRRRPELTSPEAGV
jgi:uncharacterized protein with HEPN domain